MTKITEETIERTQDFLNERYYISKMDDARPQDISYYNGALKVLEFLGISWLCDENGKHTVY